MIVTFLATAAALGWQLVPGGFIKGQSPDGNTVLIDAPEGLIAVDTGNGLGAFAAVCPGGKAPPGAPAELAQACGASLAHGTQWALIGCAAVFVWAAVHYLLAGRGLGRALEREA